MGQVDPLPRRAESPRKRLQPVSGFQREKRERSERKAKVKGSSFGGHPGERNREAGKPQLERAGAKWLGFFILLSFFQVSIFFSSRSGNHFSSVI